MSGNPGLNTIIAEYPTQNPIIERVEVDSTSTGKTLAALLNAIGVTIQDNLLRLTLVPESDGIFWRNGDVATSNAKLTSRTICITKTAAENLKFITASGTIGMEVTQEV